MITVEQAVGAAVAALPRYLGGRKPDGVRVEEVVPPGVDGMWQITLSFLEPGTPAELTNLDLALRKAMGMRTAPERVLRVFEINGENGEPRAMKLRHAG